MCAVKGLLAFSVSLIVVFTVKRKWKYNFFFHGKQISATSYSKALYHNIHNYISLLC